MEWNEKLKKIIDYVEDHLQRREEPIDENVVRKSRAVPLDSSRRYFPI